MKRKARDRPELAMCAQPASRFVNAEVASILHSMILDGVNDFMQCFKKCNL